MRCWPTSRGNGASKLRACAENHPLNEWFVAQLMSALTRCGRHGEALNAFQRLRNNLDEEIGLEPPAALNRLQLSILKGEQEFRSPVPDEPRRSARAERHREVGRLRHTAGQGAASDVEDAFVCGRQRTSHSCGRAVRWSTSAFPRQRRRQIQQFDSRLVD